MITIKNEKVGNIPVLHMSKEELFEKKQPLIFFIHGFMSAKEHNLHYAYLLAEKGFRVILPDVIHHGERESGYSEKELSSRFWKMIVQTIHELNILKEELVSRHLVLADKIGVVGTSMGGIVTNGALAAYDWISAAVSLMGNPAYVRFAEYQVEQMKKILPELDLKEKDVQEQLELLKPYDLSLNPDKLQNRPLMFWHGAKDQVVPYKFAHDFYQHIKSNYESEPDHLMFILDEKAGHKVSRFGVLQTVAWFDKHLQPTIQKV
ncbi:prolyl oligopeptidase family serine peptidase [Peribacillus asahii]|uniref:prolyl oligopeptidase family serine peptidase n=1 Tax=Peribacillus asahii TaxID=228899 RepID=UPI0037F8B5B3